MGNIKVIVKESDRPGKTTIVLAGIHGNEVCGVKAFDEIIPKIKIESGKVIFIYANLKAIDQNKRFIEKNLNRCFLRNQPPDIFNSLEGKTAREIMLYLDSAEIMLDLHASNNPDAIPFVICDETQIKNANIFDSDIVSYNWDEFEPGSTDYYMNLQNKEGFGFECGYANDEKSSEIAKRIIYNFLIFTGNISGNVLLKENQRYLRLKYLYKNKEIPFKRSRYFKDFEKIIERTPIGLDGNKEIFVDKGDIVIFVEDADKLDQECFLLFEETLINKTNLNNIKEEFSLK